MQLEAIYENGKLEFARPVHLKHGRIRLIVDIPDHEILHDDVQVQARRAPPIERPGAASAGSIRAEIDAILAPWRDRLAKLKPMSKEERRALFSEEWEERHRART